MTTIAELNSISPADFRRIGEFTKEAGISQCLRDPSKVSNALFAIVLNEPGSKPTVVAIGASIVPVYKRLLGIHKPDTTQTTNCRWHEDIATAVYNGAEVSFYATLDTEHWSKRELYAIRNLLKDSVSPAWAA
jgi:hypothetical protein